jgi:hypothetical protein
MAIRSIKKQYIPIISSLLIFFLVELNIFYAKEFMYFLVAASSVLIISVWLLAYRSSSYSNWVYYGLLPLFLLISADVYGVLIANSIIWQTLVVFIMVLNYIGLRSLYYYFEKSEMYSSYYMNNFLSSVGFLVIFFSSASIFGFISFLNMSVWPLLFLLVMVIGVILFQYYLSYGIDRWSFFSYILLISLAMLEISWAISFLPLNYTVTGLVMAVFYYMAAGLSRYHMQGGLNKGIFKFYLLFGSASICLLLISSSWK